jgi:hypothetical protein
MKKIHAICLGALVAGSHPAQALINDGKFGDPGELFISVYDETGQKSYYKDLGLNMVQFMAGQGCINGNLGQDANYAAFVGKAGLVYNVAAVNPLAKDFGNLAQWGYLATSSQGAGIFPTAFNQIDNTKQKIQGYIGALNVAPFENKPGQADAHISGVFGPTDLGYHGQGIWGPTLGQSLKGNSEGQPDKAVEFYFINNPTGAANAGKATKLGDWTLTGAGQLSYAGTGTTAACSASTANKPPVASVAGASLTVDVNTAVTLDGSASSDPDNAPQALSFAWAQLSGPAAVLANATQAKASFTPTQAGAYVFELTVSDGKDSAKAQATVTAKAPAPTGPFIKLNTPTVWKVGKKQTIAWTTQQVDAKQLVAIQFSKNGGGKFSKLKSLANNKGRFVWTPAKAHVTSQGVLKLCVSPSKTVKTPVCDQAAIVVQR